MPLLLERKSRDVSGSEKQPFNRLQKDLAYLSRHRDKLAKQYMDEYVAIHNQQLVGHAPDLDALIQTLRAKGILPNQVIVDFLTNENRTLIL